MPDPLLADQKLGSSLFPASYRVLSKDSDIIAIPEKDLNAFLTHELNVDRLNNIHKHLWMVGRPMPARALHRQRLLAREIVIVEQTDLHLVWSAKSIFIKPLPRFLLDHGFWKDNMLCKNDCTCITSQMKPKSSDDPLVCTQRKLYRGALGFLLTYVQLISHESDFNMAKGAWLLPKEVAWEHWLELVKQLIALEEPKDINKRYIYGELRLNRLNFIYRWAWWNVKDISPIRGYNYNYNQYSVFFRRNFAWVAAVFFYVTIVLTAMQVGLGTDRLKNDTRFQAASYGFTVFSILGPILAGGIALFTFFLLFLHNLAATLAFEKKTFGKLKQDKYRV